MDNTENQSTLDRIKLQIEENPILLYMKGSPKLPSCGFSSQASQALMSCGEPFAYVDILQNPDIRAELPKYANWPTFPQLWVEGELVGGCDIIIEMFQQNELQPLIKETAAKYKEAE
ncbi:Grx4 family monothiol glutaredoxin [Alteromonas macleodii]|uniref:Glutaredoxin n=1 Tax=Alteromonas macleodii TaxID=28108 RepID=A0AB36FWK7_ALTMA|nr:Grx4 family monothiol glutaredoxin [Alteromonas macleodii]OES33829.1 monothiol glutaredoxin, Grx4 family [Alteromonas macleodii]OES35629.1 monothiol glutaredoxin, Grx4 family [Alteromonas macleodii]OES37358.1 monothiol glutaredoxin, Grx4 family [Alteromonas macleodii]OES42673.1 monothiol glutaredoxin, Grx4 family [Alteromonas macleodii]OZB91473.1 monothiol glutaredoxin, Grx4 family [Alteromonas macleodii]